MCQGDGPQAKAVQELQRELRYCKCYHSSSEGWVEVGGGGGGLRSHYPWSRLRAAGHKFPYTGSLMSHPRLGVYLRYTHKHCVDR